MTKEEMAFDVANRYLHGGDREKEIILSCFPGPERDVFLRFVGLYKMFCNQKYYDAVKGAVCARIMKEVYGNEKADDQCPSGSLQRG